MRNDINNSKAEVETKSAETTSVDNTSVDNQESDAFPPMKFRMDNSEGLFNSEDKLRAGERTLSRGEIKMGFFILNPFHKTN